MTYPLEMFKDDRYRVVWSQEEKAELEKLGWTVQRPDDHPYIPHTAEAKRGPGRPKAA